MATLDEIQRILSQIRDELPFLIQRSQIAPQQIVVGEGLSDISKRLGLIQAGEFRVGNGKEPGSGFTGVRMGYPSFFYDNASWHIAGVNTDVLQFGLNASDGKAYFGAGDIVLDADGIHLKRGYNSAVEGVRDPSMIEWQNHLDPSVTTAYIQDVINSGGTGTDRLTIYKHRANSAASSESILRLWFKNADNGKYPLIYLSGDTNFSQLDIELNNSQDTPQGEGFRFYRYFDDSVYYMVFNENGVDIDVRFEGDTDVDLFRLDAGLNAAAFGGAPVSGKKLKVYGDVDITGTLASGTTSLENGESTLGGSGFTLASASGTFDDTGLSVTLPTAGTYFVTADVRGLLASNAVGEYIVAKFYNSTDAADVTDSERLIILTTAITVNHQATTPMTKKITVTGSKTIKLYAARVFTGTPTLSSIGSDANGKTVMSYVKVGP